MKMHFTLLGLCLCVCPFAEAKIWRVNNNNGVTADFTSIQAAHDGANSGDTIHVEGSANNYGGLTSSKKLIIIGPGYLLNENSDLQALQLTAESLGITYNSGSEGSEVMGISFSNNGINVFCNDIVIKRNTFLYYQGEPEQAIGGVTLYYPDGNTAIGVSNIIISQNYGIMISIQYPSTGILITNNYIAGPNYYDDNSLVLTKHADAVSIIQNNIFRRGKIQGSKSNVSNNIMFSGTFEGLGNNGTLVSNNVSNAEQFGTENGNKANVDMTTVFEATGSRDAYWKLKSGSPAKGAGFGSTNEKPVDSGMYGGSAPYVLSGIPPIPSVYFFVNQPVGSSNDPIDVTIKVRSNN